MAVAVIIWIICGFVAAVIADSRGGSALAFGCAGVILGPFGILLAFTAGPPQTAVQPVVVQAAPVAPAPEPVPASIADELAKLQQLRLDGALTDDEFDEQKRRLLS